MAVTNSVCITQTNCNKIIIQDSSDWDTTIPLIDIDSTSITITQGSTIYTKDFIGYINNIEIDSSIFGQTVTKLKDGAYNIIVTYTVDSTKYIIEEEFFIICNIQCIIDTLVADIASDPCNECNKDKKTLALNATLKLDALEAAIACGDLTKAQTILEWLNASLINYNCKNC